MSTLRRPICVALLAMATAAVVQPHVASAERELQSAIPSCRVHIVCETLPCPCLGPGQPAPEAPAPPSGPEPTPPPAEPAPAPPAEPAADEAAEECVTTDRTIRVVLDRRRHRAVLAHMRKAVRAGWDRVLVLNREGAEDRRERLLDDDRYPTRDGMDRDEWPMAFARDTWRARVAYVPSGQNRSATFRFLKALHFSVPVDIAAEVPRRSGHPHDPIEDAIARTRQRAARFAACVTVLRDSDPTFAEASAA